MKKHWTAALSTTVFCFLGLVGLAGACPPRAEADGPQDGASGRAARPAAMGTASADQAIGGCCRGKCDPASCDPATCDPSKCGGASGGGCLGAGKGFVDADGDGINDNSPLAKLDLSVEQKAQIAEIRASNPTARHEAVLSVLTEEQKADLQAIRAAAGAAHGGGCHGVAGGKCDPATCDPSKCGGASGGGCLGAGKGFVDADGDGINDNSPLAKLDLTAEQKAQIAEIRASNPAARHEAVLSVLTEEQKADLQQAIRAASGSAHGGGCHGAGGGKCDPATCDQKKCKGNDSSCPGHGASDGK